MSALVCYSRRVGRLLQCNKVLLTTSNIRSIRRTFLTTTTSFDGDKPFFQAKNTFLVGLAAILFGIAANCPSTSSFSTVLTTGATRCDGEAIKTIDPESPGPQNDFGEVPVENDPYGNLPEVDEETTCDVCNTFRKGPCRKYWRKTERCWKEGNTDKCLPYSTPFINCSMYYRNFYVLVMLDNYQEYIAVMESDTKSVNVRQFSEESSDNTPYISIDWNPWNEFNNDFGPSFCQTVPLPPSSTVVDHSNDEKLPLWQRLPPDTEPILIPCNVKILSQFTIPSNSSHDSQIMKLKIAYVTDQDGFVVGKYFTPTKFNADDDSKSDDKPQSIDEVSSDPSLETTVADVSVSTLSNDDKSALDDEVDDGALQSEIACILLPGETKSVVVTAYYTDESQSDDADETDEEALVYKKEYDLNEMLVTK